MAGYGDEEVGILVTQWMSWGDKGYTTRLAKAVTSAMFANTVLVTESHSHWGPEGFTEGEDGACGDKGRPLRLGLLGPAFLVPVLGELEAEVERFGQTMPRLHSSSGQ